MSRAVVAHPAWISAIAAVLLYAVTLGGGYVYDDVSVVHDDYRVRAVKDWSKLWTRAYYEFGADNLYRPVVSNSYAMQWWLHGDRPWAFHLINVLLHAAVSAVVAAMVYTAYRRRNAATLAGLLFAVLPIHVEAVANIVGRAELAGALTTLSSILLLLRKPLTTRAAVVAACIGTLGLFCKEQAILSPIAWGLLAWLVIDRAVPETRRGLRALLLYTIWVWAAYLVFREHLLKFEWDRSWLDPDKQPIVSSVGVDRILMPVALLGRYVWLTFWPAHLSMDYGAGVIGSTVRASDPMLWIGFASVVAGIGSAVVFFKRRDRFLLFCLLAAGVFYLPSANAVTIIGTNFGERLMYLPSAFVCMLVATGLTKFPKKVSISLAVVIVGAGFVRSFVEARDFNRPAVLFARQLAGQPKSVQLHLLLSQEQWKDGNLAAATATLRDMTDRYPNNWRVWHNRAITEMKFGDLTAADRDLKHATVISNDPSMINTRAQLEELIRTRDSTPRPTTRPTTRSMTTN